MGIKKVMGASVGRVVYIMTNEFGKWVLIAKLVAWPTAYYYMELWLEEFAYHTTLQTWIFIVSSVLSLIIAIGTVFFQSFRTAISNPVEALKYE